MSSSLSFTAPSLYHAHLLKQPLAQGDRGTVFGCFLPLELLSVLHCSV